MTACPAFTAIACLSCPHAIWRACHDSVAGYGAFETRLRFVFRAPFEGVEFEIKHMLSFEPGGRTKEMDFEISAQ